MIKKFLSVFLIICIIIFTFCGCSGSQKQRGHIVTPQNETTAIPDDNSTFKLSYSQSDSLNPLKSKTLNNIILGQLVFEGLFKLDSSYKAHLDIASKYEYTTKTSLYVELDPASEFSDGSSVSASDVEHSFDLARNSDYWSSLLSIFSSCYAITDSEVKFSLRHPDAYAQNLLIFPVVKDEDSTYPIGSGRYKFFKSGSSTVLKAVKKADFSPHIKTIHLENIFSQQSIDNAVNIGNISMSFRDMSTNYDAQITSGKKLVNMNNLVFLGINGKSGSLSNADVRKAISLAIDRYTLAKSAYGGFATVAGSVFNPDFELSHTDLFSSSSDASASSQAITQADVKGLSISILVNSSNKERVLCAQLIARQLSQSGIKAQVVRAKNNEYKSRIKNGNFDLYIGEIKLTPDMSLYPFLSSGGSARYGIDLENLKCVKSYESFMSENSSVGAFLIDFSNEMPFIPLLYKNGMICYSKAMNGDMKGTYYDNFANIEDWYFNSK